MKTTLLAALSGALLLIVGAFAPAQAQMAWHPTTAAGGAEVNPAFWDQQASYREQGAGGAIANLNITPQVITSTTSNVTYDQSTHPTTVDGSQYNVQTNAQVGTGTVTTTTNGGN